MTGIKSIRSISKKIKKLLIASVRICSDVNIRTFQNSFSGSLQVFLVLAQLLILQLGIN